MHRSRWRWCGFLWNNIGLAQGKIVHSWKTAGPWFCVLLEMSLGTLIPRRGTSSIPALCFWKSGTIISSNCWTGAQSIFDECVQLLFIHPREFSLPLSHPDLEISTGDGLREPLEGEGSENVEGWLEVPSDINFPCFPVCDLMPVEKRWSSNSFLLWAARIEVFFKWILAASQKEVCHFENKVWHISTRHIFLFLHLIFRIQKLFYSSISWHSIILWHLRYSVCKTQCETRSQADK